MPAKPKRVVYTGLTGKAELDYPLYSERVMDVLEEYPVGATFSMLRKRTKLEVNALFDTIHLLLTYRKIRVKLHHGKFVIQKLFA